MTSNTCLISERAYKLVIEQCKALFYASKVMRIEEFTTIMNLIETPFLTLVHKDISKFVVDWHSGRLTPKAGSFILICDISLILEEKSHLTYIDSLDPHVRLPFANPSKITGFQLSNIESLRFVVFEIQIDDTTNRVADDHQQRVNVHLPSYEDSFEFRQQAMNGLMKYKKAEFKTGVETVMYMKTNFPEHVALVNPLLINEKHLQLPLEIGLLEEIVW